MADDRSIKYSATVDHNPFAAGMQRVGQLLSGMQSQFGQTGRDVANITSAMTGHVKSFTSGIAQDMAGMGGHFSGLLESLGASRAGMIGLVAAAAGLAAGKAVQATAEMTEAAMDLARVLGSSTNEAQRWKIALEDVGAAQGDLEGAAKGLSKQLKENEADLQAMGLKTRDAAGNFRPMNDMLLDGIGILNEHTEGADRALAAQTMFGRGVDASSKLLLVNTETIADAQSTMEDLGLEVGQNAVAAWKEFDAASDRAGFSMKGLGNTVGKILMPVITDLINAFNAAMPTAIAVTRGAVGGLATAWHGLLNGIVVVGEAVKAIIVTVAEPVRGLAEAVGRALTGDFSGAAASIRGIAGVVSGAWGSAMDQIAASSEATRARISAIWNPDSAPGEPEGIRGTRAFKPPAKPAGKDTGGQPHQVVIHDPSKMAAYEAELAMEKQLAAQQDALRGYSKEQEASFWKEVLQRADVNGKDRLQIVRKVADLEVQILRDAAKQRQAIDAEVRAGGEQRALAAVDAASQESRGLLDLGEITATQQLEQERRFEEQRMEIKRTYLLARQALIDPDRDPVEYQRINNEIEALEQQHQQRKRQIQIELQKEAKNGPMGQVMQAAQSSMETAISGMIQRTQTLRQAMATIWAGIRQSIAGEIAKIIAQKVMMFAKERLMAIAGIGTKAAEAGAGAAASQAAIPIVGPALAMASMAAIMGSVMGLTGSIPSAAAGWSIPSGVNPMAQLHEREMVLPAQYADVIRNMGDNGGGGSQGMTVLAIPSAGGDFVRIKDLAAALKKADRNFEIRRT
jgi:hypothetical protein